MPPQFATDRKYYRDLGFTMSNDVRTQKGIETPWLCENVLKGNFLRIFYQEFQND